MNTLIWIQEWYHQKCDGEWEHEYGVSITTIDNPGWNIRIDLIGVDFEGVSIPYELVEKSSSDWYGIKVENQVFEAFGDPSKLNFLLEKFREFIVDRKKM